MADRLNAKVLGSVPGLLLATQVLSASCGGAGPLRVEPQGAVDGTRGCQPVDISADQAGQVYLAVTCPSDPTSTGLGPVASPVGGPVVFSVPPRTRIAAARAGVVYRLEEIHAENERSTDGGRSWTSMLRPNDTDHWVLTSVVAVDDRVLMGGANIGPLGMHPSPWAVDLWGFAPPAPGTGDSMRLQTIGALALSLQPASTTAWVAASLADRLQIARSDDDGRTLVATTSVPIPGPELGLHFGGATLFVSHYKAEVEVISLPPDGSMRTVSLPAEVTEPYLGEVADPGGTLTVFFVADGALSVVRLEPNASVFSAETRIGDAVDQLVAYAPSAGHVVYAGTAGGAVVQGAISW